MQLTKYKKRNNARFEYNFYSKLNNLYSKLKELRFCTMRKKIISTVDLLLHQKPRNHQLSSTNSQIEHVKLLVSDENDNHFIDVLFDVINEYRTILYETVLIRWPGPWEQTC